MRAWTTRKKIPTPLAIGCANKVDGHAPFREVLALGLSCIDRQEEMPDGVSLRRVLSGWDEHGSSG